MSETWTIGELAGRAAAMLPPGPQRPSGRVRDVPNERLIRWYTTIGLVDPPLTRRGRIALYGRRHLLQLIAVKRRQADGRSIADIQAELAGATDATLEAIARLPAAAPPDAPTGAAPEPITRLPGGAEDALAGNGAGPARPRFWAERPSPAAPAGGPAATAAPVPSPTTPATAASIPSPATPAADPPVLMPVDGEGRPVASGLLNGVRLAPGVTLLLEGRTPSPADVAAIQQAAAPLLGALRDRNLAGPSGARPAAPAGVSGSDLDRSPSEGMQA